MNIILVGFKSAGKTTLGKALSAALHSSFCDTDNLVDELYYKETGVLSTNREIVARHGEKFFRDLEKRVVKNLEHLTNTVIATGGGVVLDEQNRDVLKKLGTCIFLNAEPKLLQQRLKDSPWLQAQGEPFEILYTKRTPLYCAMADIIFPCKGEELEQSLEHIMAELREKTSYGQQ